MQILHREFWEKFGSLYAQQGQSNETYVHTFMEFFYRLFKIFRIQLFYQMRSTFIIFFSSKDVSEQRLASECFSGLLKSIRFWTIQEFEEIEKELETILDLILSSIGPYSLRNWLVAFDDATVR